MNRLGSSKPVKKILRLIFAFYQIVLFIITMPTIATKHYVLNHKQAYYRCVKKYTQNVKKLEKRKIGRGKIAILLEEVVKRSRISLRLHLHCDMDDFERPWISPHSRWKLPVAKNRKAVVS